jgi:uncharacterized protein (TIGR03435 family)
MVFDLHALGDVNALLYHLRVVRDTEDARDDRLREHRSLPDDFKPPREVNREGHDGKSCAYDPRPKCPRDRGKRLNEIVRESSMSAAKLLSVLLVIVLGVTAAAQRAEFDVASVKLHTSDDQRVMMVAQPGGRFVAANIPLRLLIRTAFQVQDDQLSGGPSWLATDRFDIEARAPGGTGPQNAELLIMLRSLLNERFKLTTHTEKRELPVFALERVRPDGSLGPGLRPTACPELAVDLSRPQPCANVQTDLGSLTLRGMPFNQFTPFLSPYVNRVVVDHTALEGRYDIELKWTAEQPGQGRSGAPEPPPSDPNAVSIFTAIQEQLGLKLNSSRDMVDVLVIDTLEHPTPN